MLNFTVHLISNLDTWKRARTSACTAGVTKKLLQMQISCEET
jgi:hypothetical protein